MDETGDVWCVHSQIGAQPRPLVVGCLSPDPGGQVSIYAMSEEHHALMLHWCSVQLGLLTMTRDVDPVGGCYRGRGSY